MKMRVESSGDFNEWKEIEKRYFDGLEAEKQRKEREEQERAEKLQKLRNMTPAEYVSYRTGKPAPLSNEELAALPMDEYIKARTR